MPSHAGEGTEPNRLDRGTPSRESEQQLILERLRLELPKQPPPRIRQAEVAALAAGHPDEVL